MLSWRFPAAPIAYSAGRLGILLVSVVLTVWLEWVPGPSDSYFANEWVRDHFIRLHATSEPELRLAVVDIDEASLSAFGPWPWPRGRIAEIVENVLGFYSGQGVALDFVFPERADDDGDKRLVGLAQHGPVVLAQAFDYAERPVPLRVGQVAGGFPETAQTGGFRNASGFIANHAALKQARHVGNIGYLPDADGTIRRLPLLTHFGQRIYPTLSLALLECCSGKASIASRTESSVRIPFTRDLSSYTVVSAVDILNMRAPVETIQGRLVILGSSALGLTDLVTTPLSPSTSGVMVHASMLSSLLDDQSGRAPHAWPGRWLALALSVLVAAAAVWRFYRQSALWNVFFLLVASIAWLFIAYWISPHDANFSTTAPLVTLMFLLAFAVPFEWRIAQLESRHVLLVLRQYVAKSVVDELLRSDIENPLAPRRLDVTTLVADMEGYTAQVAAESIEESAALTHDFLECLTAPVLEKRGTLDKYTGDGLVAFWGAPLSMDDHADLALEAAIDILQNVSRLSEARQKAGKPPLRVRIGIESGLALAGDFGNALRSTYTAVGDSVNVAARLEDMARGLPYDIVVGPGTADRARRFRLRPLGQQLLRGRDKPIEMFALEAGTGDHVGR